MRDRDGKVGGGRCGVTGYPLPRASAQPPSFQSSAQVTHLRHFWRLSAALPNLLLTALRWPLCLSHHARTSEQQRQQLSPPSGRPHARRCRLPRSLGSFSAAEGAAEATVAAAEAAGEHDRLQADEEGGSAVPPLRVAPPASFCFCLACDPARSCVL